MEHHPPCEGGTLRARRPALQGSRALRHGEAPIEVQSGEHVF